MCLFIYHSIDIRVGMSGFNAILFINCEYGLQGPGRLGRPHRVAAWALQAVLGPSYTVAVF